MRKQHRALSSTGGSLPSETKVVERHLIQGFAKAVLRGVLVTCLLTITKYQAKAM